VRTSQFAVPLHKIGCGVPLTVTPSVVQWSEFLVRDPEVPGSNSGTTRFSEK
jgi:hypothetical protein